MTLVEPCFVFWRDFNHTSLICLNEPKTRVQLYLPSPLPPHPTYNVKSFHLGRGDSKAFFKVFSFVNCVAMCLWSTHWELSKNSRFNFRKISSGEWNNTSRNFQKRGQPREAKIYYFGIFLTECPKFLGWLVHMTVIQQYLNLPGTFRANFRTISVSDDSSGILNWMKALTEGWCSLAHTHKQTQEDITKGAT